MDFAIPAIDTTTLAEIGVEVRLKDIHGDPLVNAKGDPVSLTLLGADSAAYRKASRTEARKAMARSKAMKERDSKEVTDADLDAATEDALQVIVACTVGWSGVIDTKHATVPLNPENVRAFYKAFPVALEQASAAIVDRARFTKPSSEGSSTSQNGGSNKSDQPATATA